MPDDSALISRNEYGEDNPKPAELRTLFPLSSEEIFIAYYSKYYDLVKKNAYRYLPTIQDAEDITQNIFRKLWEKRDRLHLIDQAERYLYVSVRNQCLDEKRIAARTNMAIQHFTSEQSSCEDSTELYMREKESLQMIETHIQQLPRRTKTAIQLKLEGYKLKDIVIRMNSKPNTVKNQLQSARKVLALALSS